MALRSPWARDIEPEQPLPGNIHGWALYWQMRAASISALAREWRERDTVISNTYQETACEYYKRARHLVGKLR
jgi:hypothetical protein